MQGTKDKAIAYANDWYNKHNPNYYWYQGSNADCANFVSQCLFAGGIQKDGSWYSYRKEFDPLGFAKWYVVYGPRGMVMWQSNQEINTSWWYKWNVSSAWRKVTSQYKYFTQGAGKKYKKSYFVFDKNNIQGAIDLGLQKGDLMYFDHTGNFTPDHAVMVKKVTSDKIFYTAHSNNQKEANINVEFKANPNAKIFAIRLKDSW